MSAPRVLVCGTTLSQQMGGVRRHVEQLLPRVAALLDAAGGSLTLLAGREGLPFELPRSVAVLESRVPARPALARFLRESTALAEVLERARADGRRFDLVHTDHLPAPRGLALPFTLTLHDLKSVKLASEPMARRLVGRRVLRDAVGRASRVLCVSHTLAREVHELLDVDAAKLAVVPNGCDHLPLHERAPSRPAFLLCVGRLEPRKNWEIVLRTLACEPGELEARFAGGSKGDHQARLRELARRLGIESRVHFLGLVDDRTLARLYATCAAVVLPSVREGFDIPLAEALRARAPVVASRLEVHVEIAGDLALYFDAGAERLPRETLDLALAQRAPDPPPLATWDDAARACFEAWSRAAR